MRKTEIQTAGAHFGTIYALSCMAANVKQRMDAPLVNEHGAGRTGSDRSLFSTGRSRCLRSKSSSVVRGSNVRT
jgi:hypothetical protein